MDEKTPFSREHDSSMPYSSRSSHFFAPSSFSTPSPPLHPRRSALILRLIDNLLCSPFFANNFQSEIENKQDFNGILEYLRVQPFVLQQKREGRHGYRSVFSGVHDAVRRVVCCRRRRTRERIHEYFAAIKSG